MSYSCSAEQVEELRERVKGSRPSLVDFVVRNAEIFYHLNDESLQVALEVADSLLIAGEAREPWNSGLQIQRVMFANVDKAKYCPNQKNCDSTTLGWDGTRKFRVCSFCGTLVLPTWLSFLGTDFWGLKKFQLSLALRNKVRDIRDTEIAQHASEALSAIRTKTRFLRKDRKTNLP